MGKNSNVHKSQATLAEDVRKEREADEKKAKKRAKAEEKLAAQRGEMLIAGRGRRKSTLQQDER